MLETITKSHGGSGITPLGFKEFDQPWQTDVFGGQKASRYKMNLNASGFG
jgi:hypothetical protein